jgi:ribosomal protein L20
LLFINALKKANIVVDRKMLADVAGRDSKAFEVFVNEANAVM